MAKFWHMLTAVSKFGIFGGAVYVTVKHGLWSSSNADGAKALTDFREKVIPATNDYIKRIPDSESMTQSVKSRWNSGVEWTANGLANLPETMVQTTKNGVNKLLQTMKSQPADK